VESVRDDPHEPYIILQFNPNNSEQTQVYAEIDKQSEVLRWMLPSTASTPKELDWLTRESYLDPENPRQLFPVADRRGNILGWVQYKPDEEQRIDDVKKQIDIPDDSIVLEISYAKLFGRSPDSLSGDDFQSHGKSIPMNGNPGVAINGVKQTLEILHEREALISKAANKPSRKIVVTAYTDLGNQASESVLRKNGFQPLPENIDYGGEANKAWVRFV